MLHVSMLLFFVYDACVDAARDFCSLWHDHGRDFVARDFLFSILNTKISFLQNKLPSSEPVGFQCNIDLV